MADMLVINGFVSLQYRMAFDEEPHKEREPAGKRA